jgi:quercetin dioxygenase-like cupin family protein
MSDQMALAKPSAMRVNIGTEKTSRVVPGRRPELRYREYGVTDATNGRLRAQVFSGDAVARPTGWHHHVCDMQFIYQLTGWIELEFHDRGLVRFNAGDTALIPGGLVHQEVRTSDSFSLLEISTPADLGTVNCDPPSAATRKPAIALATTTPGTRRQIEGRRSFFKYYDLGVTEATGGKMRAQITTTDVGLSQPTGWHYHTCEMQFVYLLDGWVDLDFADGSACRMQPGDSVLIPGDVPHQEVKTSPTFKFLEITLPGEMGTVPCDQPASAKRG